MTTERDELAGSDHCSMPGRRGGGCVSPAAEKVSHPEAAVPRDSTLLDGTPQVFDSYGRTRVTSLERTTTGRVALLTRLRNVLSQSDVPRSDHAAVLRMLLAEIEPDVDADVQLQQQVAFWVEQLRAEGYAVTPDCLVGTAGAARVLDCHEVTLRKRREDPDAPPLHDRLGGRVRYSVAALLAYRGSRQRSPA